MTAITAVEVRRAPLSLAVDGIISRQTLPPIHLTFLLILTAPLFFFLSCYQDTSKLQAAVPDLPLLNIHDSIHCVYQRMRVNLGLEVPAAAASEASAEEHGCL